MYNFGSFLSLTSILGILAGLGIISAGFFAIKFLQLKNKSPIAAVEIVAKDKKLPIIEVIDPTGNTEYYVGEVDKKEKDKDVKFKGDHLGLQIRPELLTQVESKRTPSGVPIYTYATQWYFVQSTTQNRATIRAVDHIRETRSNLKFIYDDLKLLELVFTPSDQLAKDCATILTQFEQDTDPQTVLIDDEGNYIDESGNLVSEPVYVENENHFDSASLKDEIEDIKDEITGLYLKPGYVSMARALNYIMVGTDTMDMKSIIQEVKRGMQMQQKENYQLYMILGITAAIVFIGAGIAYYFFNM